uniref:FAD-binding PCMH-type domain-containing protein n=1 Tax=Aureoumbra lagunensis TaxID=44058 RepID=A0A7S3JT35_9STRA
MAHSVDTVHLDGLSLCMQSREKKLKGADLEKAFDGNICRCTGYAPIIKAIKQLQDIEDIQDNQNCFDVTTGERCGRACDDAAKAITNDLAVIDSERGIAYKAPTTLQNLYTALDIEPNASLIGGSTAAIGVSKYYDDALGTPWIGGFLAPSVSLNTIIATKTVSELGSIQISTDEICIGAAVTLTDLLECLEEAGSTPQLTAATRHLKRVANTQVRNSATWAGNLVLLAKASGFISDVLVALCVAEAKIDLSLCSSNTKRSVVSLEPTELIATLRASSTLKPVILKARIPLVPTSEKVVAFCDKVAARHANAHAITNCGLVMRLDGTTIKKAICIFGGLNSSIYKMKKIESSLIDAQVTAQTTLSNAIAALRTSSTDGNSYEADLGTSFLYKWFVCAIDPSSSIITSLAFDRPETESSYDINGATDPNNDPASMPRTKLAARLQASGEAKYCTDVVKAKNEVFCAFAYAKSAGTLTSISTTSALRVLNTVIVYTALDLIDAYGAVGTMADDDDPLLYELNQNVFVGARVAIAVATTYEDAIQAARAVVITIDTNCTPLQKRLVLISKSDVDNLYATTPRKPSEKLSATRGKSRKLGLPRTGLQVQNGVVRLDFAPSSPLQLDESEEVVRIDGSVSQLSQKHFTMETHAARAIPIEGGNLEVWSSSQDNALTQQTIAAALGKYDHNIVVKCRRAGGGFGSKLSLHLAVATAVSVVTDLLGRPARLHAERRDDQKMTGGREPCVSSYTLTAKKEKWTFTYVFY